MAIHSLLSPDGSELTISIDGRFDFRAHQDFRRCYEALDHRPKSYCVDLKGATYLDSSALGMLLLLRDHAGGDKASVAVVNCNSDVTKILKLSNFDQLFTIS